jgi:hypothetical protein
MAPRHFFLRLSLLACVASRWRLRFLSLRRRFMLDPPPHRRACRRPLVAKHCGMSNDVDDRALLYRSWPNVTEMTARQRMPRPARLR